MTLLVHKGVPRQKGYGLLFSKLPQASTRTTHGLISPQRGGFINPLRLAGNLVKTLIGTLSPRTSEMQYGTGIWSDFLKPTMKKAIPHIAKFALNTGMDVIQNKRSLKNALMQRGKEAVTNLVKGPTLARAPPAVASRLAGQKRAGTKGHSSIKKKRMRPSLQSTPTSKSKQVAREQDIFD